MNAMATFIIIFLLACAIQDVQSKCQTPNFVEYGNDGLLKCKFERDAVGLYWYEVINSTPELQIKQEAGPDGNIVISGNGYENGAFDILYDGSLVISNVTNYQTRTFKVVHVNSDYLVTESFVELVTSIVSYQEYPSINVCDGENMCFVDSNEFYNLTCSYHDNRPAVEMVWYRQSHTGIDIIKQNASFFKDGNWTFSSILNVDVTYFINGPLIAFICRVSSPAFSSVGMESSVVIYSKEKSWQSIVQANRTDTYYLINSSAEVRCSQGGSTQLLLWGEIRGGYWEARAFYINGKVKYFGNFTSEWRISQEGSIFVDRMTFQSQGLYTCITINDRKYNSVENGITVEVPPSPPFIVANGCPLEDKLCEISLQGVNTDFSMSCTVMNVYPRLDLGIESTYNPNNTSISTQTFKSNDGQTYDTKTQILLQSPKCGMVQNVTCFTIGPDRLQIISNKTITILRECVIQGSKAVAVTLPIVAVLVVLVVSVAVFAVLYVRSRTKRKQKDADEESSKDSKHSSEKLQRLTEAENLSDTQATNDPELHSGTNMSTGSRMFAEKDLMESQTSTKKDTDEESSKDSKHSSENLQQLTEAENLSDTQATNDPELHSGTNMSTGSRMFAEKDLMESQTSTKKDTDEESSKDSKHSSENLQLLTEAENLSDTQEMSKSPEVPNTSESTPLLLKEEVNLSDTKVKLLSKAGGTFNEEVVEMLKSINDEWKAIQSRRKSNGSAPSLSTIWTKCVRNYWQHREGSSSEKQETVDTHQIRATLNRYIEIAIKLIDEKGKTNEECNSAINFNGEEITKGVIAAKKILESMGEPVDISIPGRQHLSDCTTDEQTFESFDEMIEIMEQMNEEARSVNS